MTGLYFLSPGGWTLKFAGCRAKHTVGHLEREVARRQSQCRLISGGVFGWFLFYFRGGGVCPCILLVPMTVRAGLSRTADRFHVVLRPYYTFGPKTPQS